MKKVLVFLSSAVCLFAAVLSVLLFSVSITSTSSRYVTTATQYGMVETTMPAILNQQVNLSFYYNSDGNLPESETYDTDNTLYVKSSYSSTSGKAYAVKLDNVGKIGSTNTYGLTNYFGTCIINDDELNPLEFVDFFGVTKDEEDYGTLTDTSTNTKYTMPLVTEATVGSTNDTKIDAYTTLNITPFKDKVQMTVYFTMRTKTSGGDERSSPYYAFMFNGEEIWYNNGTNTGSEGVKISTYNDTNEYYELDGYTFTAGENTKTNESISTHQLYSYTTVLDAETATNIMTGTDNQTMIFLIVLEPYNPLTVVDGDGDTAGGTITGNTAQTFTVEYDSSKTGENISSDSDITVTSSNEDVATVGEVSTVTSNSKYSFTVTPVAVGSTTITVTATDSANTTYTKTYALTVENTLTLKNNGTEIGNDAQTIDKAGDTLSIEASLALTDSGATYKAESNDTSVAEASADGSTITVTGKSVGSAEITVTATGSDGKEPTQTFTVYVNGYVIKAADGTTTTTVYKNKTLELGLYAMKNGNVENSASTGLSVEWKSSDENIATVTDGTVTGVAAGDVTITATIDNVGYSIRLTVSEPKIEIADEYIIIGTSASSTVNVTYDVITYDDIESGEISVTDSSGDTTNDITAEISGSGLTITISDATTGVYKVTITDSATGATDYVYVVVGKEETNNVNYTATYTINSSADGAKDESAFNVSVVVGSGSAATDSSGAITVSGGGSNGIKYNKDEETYSDFSGYSEFRTSRYAKITVDDAASISKITVYASASNTTRILYITTSEPSSSTPDSDAIKASDSSTGNTFNISADSLSGGTYYVWASNTIYVYAIVIEYTVAETTVNISSVSTSTVSITGTGSNTITCIAGAEVISLNTSIATVTEDGGTVTVTGVAVGTTYILVNDNGILKLYQVTVTDSSG